MLRGDAGLHAGKEHPREAQVGEGVRAFTRLMRPTPLATKRYDFVIGVMPDVGASQKGNPSSAAPVSGNLFFVHPEVRLVRRDAAATAEHDSRGAPDVG